MVFRRCNSLYECKNGLVSHFYGYERGTETCQTTGQCDTDRPTSWIGKVGLMYPSDYGYATSGGSTTTREVCLKKEMYNWENEDISDCKNNDWIYKSLNPTGDNFSQWTLSSYSEFLHHVFSVRYTGFVSSYGSNLKYAVRPVVYLLSDIQYIQGTGSKEDPFAFLK